MPARAKGYITIGFLVSLLFLSGVWYAASPVISKLEASPLPFIETQPEPLYSGKHVVVNLETMRVDLRDGTTTLHSLPIVTKGKPGSYYETIGGSYTHDYKLKNHFSSFGSVYMPWSTHVFGNFFIHGIPYYPDGTKVSTSYSGGCVRLEDNDAKLVYDFVERGTPIIITKEEVEDFAPTATSTPDVASLTMTRLMVVVISLEMLMQEDQLIRDTDGTLTDRKSLIPRIIRQGDDRASMLLAQSFGEKTYINYMNQRAQTLGLTNTTFSSVTQPAQTTQEDLERFTQHVADYKSYLLAFAPSTQALSR